MNLAISGASERSTAEASISRMVRRLRSARALAVATFIPSLTRLKHAGRSGLTPSTSTTQMRHKPLAVQCSW
jgi:hypothetical protein